jgi:hypothetical protein
MQDPSRIAIALLAAVATIAGCGGGGLGANPGTDNPNTARVRSLHALTDSSDIHVNLGTRRLADALELGEAGLYRSVPPTQQNVSVLRASDNGLVFPARPVQPRTNISQTLLIAGTIANPTVALIDDTPGEAPEDFTKLRFIHAASGASNQTVDVYVTSTESTFRARTFRAISFARASAIQVVPSATVRVRVYPTGQQTPVLAELTGVPLSSRGFSTFLLLTEADGRLDFARINE